MENDVREPPVESSVTAHDLAHQTKYVVITPVRDEENHLRSTIECMLRQTVLPVEWVIVNDGSRDTTGKIIDEYARRYSWIRAVHRVDRGFRKPGGGVVEAFNAGYETLTCTDWKFLAKFDGDLSFEPDYFEKCFRRFIVRPTLGVGGGTICYLIDGEKKLERAPRFHVRGATKIYRRDCWQQIGGLWPAAGWDTIDEVKANFLGWTTRSFEDLHLVHYRVTGAADGFWQALVKYGRANYICGYHPLFMFMKCLKRVLENPPVVGSIALMYGFASGYLKGIPQVNDPEVITYLRREQVRRLLGRPSIWQ